MPSPPAASALVQDLWPPWATPSEWREVNDALVHLMGHHADALPPLVRMARNIGERLEAVFPVMDHLCCLTCPECREPCCRVAKPWFDLRDLLFLHLAGGGIAPSQPIAGRRDHCRYLTPKGCSLPRIERPWICTWYLCPVQKKILRSETPDSVWETEEALKWIADRRKQLEAEWIARI